MFTGIIQEVGYIKSIRPLEDGITTIIACSHMLEGIEIGESITVNGVCSTVTAFTEDGFQCDYMAETLSKTTFSELEKGMKVNLEKSLTPSSKLGGHFVTGHIDTVGRISKFEIKEPWGEIEISFSSDFAQYLIPKGSIAIDGISLTVVDVTDCTFTCHLIPHTLDETILHVKSKGDKVNLEFDMIGKYLYRFHQLSPK